MSFKIKIITGEFLHSFVKEMFENVGSICDIEIIPYDSFKSLPDIYSKYKNDTDGFLISGIVAQCALEKNIDCIKKPIAYFSTDLLDIYHTLLSYFVQDSNLRSDRVFIDFLIPLRDDASCLNIINSNIDLLGEEMKTWTNNMSSTELYSFEDFMVDKILSLWNENKFDLLVCTYSSIVPILKNNGVNCVFAYPSFNYSKDILNRLVNTIQLNTLKENAPVVISIGLRTDWNMDLYDFNTVSLQKCILDFKEEYMTDFIIQKSIDGFDVFTSFNILNDITDGLKICKLSKYIEKNLNFKVNIGYGIGSNIYQSKNHGYIAKKESISSGESFVFDENKNLIGPLNQDELLTICSEVKPEIEKLAKQSSLSTLTIQKLQSIMSIMNTDELTTQDISNKLNVTTRNANRILNNLEKSGLAQIIYNKANNSKGRPVKIYKILFSI